MDKQHILTRTGKVVFPIYNQALSIAWQELVDRGFATRDPNDPKLITVQYPVEPGSTQMQTKVVDISQQLLITSTTQKKGFNYNNDTVWVQIKVDPNSHQLQLEAYQNPQYIDSELVPALGLAFNTFAQGSGYEGPLPAITAFNDIDLDK